MIKFRGIPLRDVDDICKIADCDGTFVYGYYIKNGDGAMIGSYRTKELDGGGLSKWFEDVFPETVEQFTGLTDVNGKEIYIGDIVRVWSDVSELTMEPRINKIVSEDLLGRTGVFLKQAGPHLFEPCLYESFTRSNQFEVIGNVHENAELLEANK